MYLVVNGSVSKTTKDNTNKFLTNPLMTSLTKKLSYKIADK